MKFYKERLPEPGDLVVGRITKVNQEIGINVSLLEYDNDVTESNYDNYQAMIQLGESTRKRRVNLKKLFRVGTDEVLEVVKVDKEKGYIDLSKKTVTENESKETLKRYNNRKNLIECMKFLSRKTDIPLENLMEQYVWGSLEKDTDFRMFFWSQVMEITSQEGVQHFSKEHYEILKEKVKPLVYSCVATVEVRCFDKDGLTVIKDAFSDIPNSKLISPPQYSISFEGSDPEDVRSKVDKQVNKILENPKVVSKLVCKENTVY